MTSDLNFFDEINRRLTAAHLGECAIVSQRDSGRFVACLYLQPDFCNSAQVASWLHELGANNVEIEHTLYSDEDEAWDGLMHGCQAWQVSFDHPDAVVEDEAAFG